VTLNLQLGNFDDFGQHRFVMVHLILRRWRCLVRDTILERFILQVVGHITSQNMPSADDTMNVVPDETAPTASDTTQQEHVNLEAGTPAQPIQHSAMEVVSTVDVQEETELVDPDMEGITETAQAAGVEAIEKEVANVAQTASSVSPRNAAIPQDLEMIMNMVVDGRDSGGVVGTAGNSQDTRMTETAEMDSDR
jgi:hypothetical protein